jgi:hypothetical protein
VRRLLVHLAAVALAVVGSQVAHSLVYRIVAPSADQRAHLLAETGHAYLRLAPLGLALATVLVGLALVSEARSAGSGLASSRPRLWLFAAVAPATFACQEIFERLLHDGTFPWGAPLERTFLLGLVLQLPFAVAAYALARLLVGAARAVGRILGAGLPASLRLPEAVRPVAALWCPRPGGTRPGVGPRAPPVATA